MSDFLKNNINTLELIKQFWPALDISHITYNPNMRKGQYFIIRQMTHDGTQAFTIELFAEALELLVCRASFYKRDTPNTFENIRYTVGPIKHSVVYGKVQLPCGLYPGQKERIRIPIICEWR